MSLDITLLMKDAISPTYDWNLECLSARHQLMLKIFFRKVDSRVW